MDAEQLLPSRVLLDACDSLHQRLRVEAESAHLQQGGSFTITADADRVDIENRLVDELRLSLRVAALVASQVVLLDSQALDGPLLLALGPSGVMATTGMDAHTGSIVLSARKCEAKCDMPVVEQVLIEMWAPAEPQDGWLGFNSSALRAEAALNGFPIPRPFRLRTRPQTLDDLVAGLKKQLGEQWNDVVERLHVRWLAWIEAVESGLIRLERYDIDDFPTSVCPKFPANCKWGDGAYAIAEEISKTTKRSSALLSIEDGYGEDRINATEQMELFQWWNESYMAAQAQQHQARWVTIRAVSDGAEPVVYERDANKQRVMGFSGDIIERLAEMNDAAFAVVRFRARRAIERWDKEPSERALDSVARAVTELTEPIDHKADVQKTILRVVITVILALVAAIGSNSVTGVSLQATFLVVGAFGVLAALPVGDLIDLFKGRTATTRAIIHLEQGVIQ